MSEWLAATDVLDRLGLKPQTLYAYVSRGLLAARPDPADSRRSLYRAEDVAALAARRGQSRRRSEVAAGAMTWGEPVLSSAISTVRHGRPWYRGRDTLLLAETETLESVARLLRGGDGVTLKRSDRPDPPAAGPPLSRAFLALAARAAEAPPALGQPALVRSAEAALLLDIFADALAAETDSGPIHLRLAKAWRLGPGGPGADLIRRALVLLADHELNPSAFAARVAASTGASLAACALAGLAALSGPRHGFTPAGDLVRLADQVRATTGLAPNVDFALVALCDHLGAPEGAALSLFAAARCAGWLAHALEQGQDGGLIRPRARYTGPPPDPEA